VQAANGPLVGNPSLIPQELSCVRSEGNAPWYPAIAAFEVHDSTRTHLYYCAHFTGSMTGGNQVFACSSPQDYITPYNIGGAHRDRLEDLAGIDAERPRLVDRGVGLRVADGLERDAAGLEMLGYLRHHPAPLSPGNRA
jgi:hypothetical protein